MKKLCMYAIAPALALVLSASFSAQATENGNGGDPDGGITVKGDYQFEKEKTVVEAIYKLKGALIVSYALVVGNGAAEAEVAITQQNTDQEVDHDHGLSGDGNPLQLSAEIAGSLNGNSGVVQLNQDVGNMVNQGNVASVAVTGADRAFADSIAAASQKNTDNESTTRVPLTFLPNKTATISNSINNNEGIVHVNQNTGDMNNQLNATSIAVAEGAVVALGETDLGQLNTGNTIGDVNTFKFDTINGSVNGNSGITNVNQSSGKFNNQATIVSFAGSASIN